MPVRAIHVFASQKGGTGKTLISAQVAAAYADAHPAESVLYMDLTELGDGTKRLFGGLDRAKGLEGKLGAVFELLGSARAAEEEEERQGAGKGVLGRVKGLFRGSGDSTKSFAIEDYAVHVSSINSERGIPDNIYLVSSGGATISAAGVQETVGMHTHEDRRRICEALRRALSDSEKTWRVFVDTDGDRRPQPLTRLGYLLADFAVVPILPDECDFQRVEQMITILSQLRNAGEALCQIQCLCWNKVQVRTGQPSSIGNFTPPKVTIDTIESLNSKLAKLKETCGDVFAPSFRSVLVKDFPDTVWMPASANGLVFCRMGAGKVTTRGGISFDVKKDQLQTCVDGILNILENLEPDAVA